VGEENGLTVCRVLHKEKEGLGGRERRYGGNKRIKVGVVVCVT